LEDVVSGGAGFAGTSDSVGGGASEGLDVAGELVGLEDVSGGTCVAGADQSARSRSVVGGTSGDEVSLGVYHGTECYYRKQQEGSSSHWI